MSRYLPFTDERNASEAQPLLSNANEFENEEAVITIQDDRPRPFSWRKLMLHLGPGFLMCIAYIDPGNLEADLQTGALTNYSLLWVMLWATFLGFILQSLSAKLGVTTNKHLAQHCREQYPPLPRYTLWVMAELAIIGSDIQEVIGTAIALLLLTQGALPLWAGVVITALVAYVLLFMEKLGLHWLEYFFQAAIGLMTLSFGAMFFYAQVPYKQVLKGLLIPTLDIKALPTAAGLVGSIIMPHNLYLHSALVHSRVLRTTTQQHSSSSSSSSSSPTRRLQSCQSHECTPRESLFYYTIEAALALGVTILINTSVISVFAKGFYGDHGANIGMENAGYYLGERFGTSMKIIWGIGLLAAGQSSTMTGTYAGQFVMSGFLNLNMNLTTRALITRGVAIFPTLFVALAHYNDSTKLDVLSQWLNVLQAVQLPFAVVPLLVLTSSPGVVGVGFANSRFQNIICWSIAIGIVCINGIIAYVTAVHHLPSILSVHIAFWIVVVVYSLFLVYLVYISNSKTMIDNHFDADENTWNGDTGNGDELNALLLGGGSMISPRERLPISSGLYNNHLSPSKKVRDQNRNQRQIDSYALLSGSSTPKE